MIFFSRSRASSYQYSVWMIKNLEPIWIIFLYVLYFNNIKVNHFFYSFIVLLHLVSSFSFTRYLLVPYAYVSIELIDCIVLLSFELKKILLISSVKTLCLSLLNLCCVFDIDLLFLMISLWFFRTIYINFIFS